MATHEEDRRAKAGTLDRVTLPTAGGPREARRPDGGAGQLVPGPIDQALGSTGPFPAGGFSDNPDPLIDAGGSELHRAPDQLRGGELIEKAAAVEEIGADEALSAMGEADRGYHEAPGVGQGLRFFDRHGGVTEELLFFDLQLDAGFVIGSYQWGAVIPTGTPPEVVSAIGGGGAGLPGSVVRVTFNVAMRDHPYLGGVLDPLNYSIVHDGTSRRLPVIVVKRVASNVVDLYTEEFPTPHADDYTVTVKNVESANGDVIAGVNNSDQFSAAGTGFPLGTELHTWYGLEAGFQSDNATGIDPDTDPPVLQNQNPSPLDTGVAIDQNLVLEIVDTGAGLDPSSVVLKVNGATAWENDAQKPGFVVAKDPVVDGWKYTINPDALLPEGLPTTIAVYARDASPFPNVLDTSYFFTTGFVDIVGPYLTNQNPAAGGEGTIGQDIVFEVRDDKTNIDDSQTTIWIAGAPARINGVDQPGFSVTRVVLSLPFPQKGVRYTVDPAVDFLPSIIVLVRVKTQDSAGPPNVIDQTYSYETTPDVTPPQLVRLNPAAEEEDVQPTRGVRLSLIDDFQVVDLSIQIWIRDVLAYYQGAFRAGFISSVKQVNAEHGFDFVIVPDPDLRWLRNERVEVRVVAQDTVPNTIDVTYFFGGEIAPEQPFSVYRMIMQAVRDHDEQSPGLLSGICEAFDQVWESTMFDRATDLPDLIDPDRIPARWLPWLKSQVGFTRDLTFDPTEAELRRVIKGGVELWNDKPAEEAIRDAIRLTTGNRFIVRDYFDLRFEVDKARLVEELEDFDPDVLLFSPNAYLEVQRLRTCDASSLYPCSHQFWFNDPNVPDFTDPKQFTHLLITAHPTVGLHGLYEIDQLTIGAKSGLIKGPVGFPVQTATEGPAKLLHTPSDYTTEIRLVDPGVGALKYRSLTAAFTVGQRVIGQNTGASGELQTVVPVPGTASGVFELTHVIGRFEPNESLIDSGAGAAIADGKLEDLTHLGEVFKVLNRDLLDFLVRQVRPFSERYDVIFVDFIDQFLSAGDLELWDTSTSGVSIPAPGGELQLIAPSAWAFPKTVIGAEWRDQVATWKVQGPSTLVADLWFMAISTTNGYKVEVDFGARTVELFKVVGGTPTSIGGPIYLPTAIVPDNNLVVRVDALAEGAGTRIRVKVEGDLQIDVLDSPAAFIKGKLGVSASGTGMLKTKLVEVNTVPTEIQRIGPTP